MPQSRLSNLLEETELSNVQFSIDTITNPMPLSPVCSSRAGEAFKFNITTITVIFFCFHRSGCWFFCLRLSFANSIFGGIFVHIGSLKRGWFGGFLLFALLVINVQTLHDLIGVSSVSCFQQHVNVDSELNCVASWSRSEVVLSSLQSLAPTVEMHQ